MLIKFSNFLEKLARRIKIKFCEKKQRAFLKKFKLVDGYKTKIDNLHYNPYMASSILLIEKLIKNELISRNSKILDVGCGAGIALCYFLANNFTNLSGCELNKKLVDLANKNVKNIPSFANSIVNIYNADFFDMKSLNNFDVFYLFNPFSDFITYKRCVEFISKSLVECPREVKVIINNPTIVSMDAFDSSHCFKRECQIIDERQPCSHCRKLLIYTNVLADKLETK